MKQYKNKTFAEMKNLKNLKTKKRRENKNR